MAYCWGHSSYDDWYDSGPGSESFKRSCSAQPLKRLIQEHPSAPPGSIADLRKSMEKWFVADQIDSMPCLGSDRFRDVANSIAVEKTKKLINAIMPELLDLVHGNSEKYKGGNDGR